MALGEMRSSGRIVLSGLVVLFVSVGIAADMASPASASKSSNTGYDQTTSASTPPVRGEASMAYDASNGEMVLFGGAGYSGLLSDTWNWNGSTWSEVTTPTAPSGRAGASMAYDASTGDVILFGGQGADLTGANGYSGLLGDTWSWNGATWTELAPSTSPPARSGASMAYDASTGDIVLYGGSGVHGLLNDTWTWNGSNWTSQSPAESPPARYTATMDYDTVSGNLVLFGGFGFTTPLNDTWTWNGVTWTQQSPAMIPQPRWNASMGYDASTETMVLFGGLGATPPLPFGANALNDTWTSNGSTWTQQSPTSSPPAAGGASMAYDASNGVMVLFVGDDTWTWNGSSWSFADRIPVILWPLPTAGSSRSAMRSSTAQWADST